MLDTEETLCTEVLFYEPKLPRSENIASILPISDGSMVLFIHKNLKSKFVSKLKHISQFGKTMWQYQFKRRIGNVLHVRDNQILFYYEKQATIFVLFLNTHQIIMIQRPETQQLDDIYIEFFSESGLIALIFSIHEKGINDKVMYFDYEDFKRGEKHLAEWHLEQKQQSSQSVVSSKSYRFYHDYFPPSISIPEPILSPDFKKLDNKSKLGKWPTIIKQYNKLKFSFIYLDKDNNIIQNTIETEKDLSSCMKNYSFDDKNIKISLWEFQENKFIVHNHQFQEVQFFGEQQSYEQQYPSFHGRFIVDATQSYEAAQFKQSQQIPHQYFSYFRVYMNCQRAGNFTVYKWKNDPYADIENEDEAARIYLEHQPDDKWLYYHNPTGQFLDEEAFTILNGKVFASDLDPSVLAVWGSQKQQQESMNSKKFIQVRRLSTLKDIYMCMLLHINEDFDDDLLQESIQLLLQQE